MPKKQTNRCAHRCSAMFSITLIMIATMLLPLHTARACTGITLQAKDGSFIQGRTMEWGAFDLHSQIMVTPRGLELKGMTPDGKPGLQWKSRYGVLGLNAVDKPIYGDGLNEKGLAVSVLYLPGFAEYQPYDPKQAQISMSSVDLPMWILTNFATVDEVREGLPAVKVVPVNVEEFGGGPVPLHYYVSDNTGKSIVVEYLKGELNIFDNPVGALTNAPEFPWHLNNLRNYVGLRPQAWAPIKVGDLEVSPLGAGSGMIGLPGDFSPPSRFVRAVALRNTARPLVDGEDAILEAFRILNNFDLPLGAVDAPGKDIIGSTIWTSAMDTKALGYYYHTQYNSRLRVIDLKTVDFTKNEITYVPMEKDKKPNFEKVVIP